MKENILQIKAANPSYGSRKISSLANCSRSLVRYFTNEKFKGDTDKRNLNKRYTIRPKLIALFGGKCARCGYNECSAALDFHHINPKSKQFTINNSCTKNFDRQLAEAKKCALLCSNCHRALHVGLFTLSDLVIVNDVYN